jgi:Rrf2 family protein
MCYMRTDSRLSSVLHVLLHIAHSPRPLTSEELARSWRTNPVVVRRTLADLRKAGYVSSTKGHGGGWTLAVDLRSLTLRDIYDAIGAPPLLTIGHRKTSPACVVEQAVNSAVNEAMRDAERLLVERFARVTLADLADDFRQRLARRGNKECPRVL